MSLRRILIVCISIFIIRIPISNSATPRTRLPPKFDVVMAIDSAYQGFGDRTPDDVNLNALKPFLNYFVEKLWRNASAVDSQVRVAVIEMAKNSSVLVELSEGTSPKGVMETFTEKVDRRLPEKDRNSTTHIFRMLNLTSSSICDMNGTSSSNPCVLIMVTVAPRPVRVPFVGADWPSWRKVGDAMIHSAFDLGVDVVVLTTGFRQRTFSKPAGLSEMARVEARLYYSGPFPSKETTKETNGTSPNKEDNGTTPAPTPPATPTTPSKPQWVLDYWQAGYDRMSTVDERVANQTVAGVVQKFTNPLDIPRMPIIDEKPIPPPSESPNSGESGAKKDEKVNVVVEGEDVQAKTFVRGLIDLAMPVLIGSYVGFALKEVFCIVMGIERGDLGVRALKVLLFDVVVYLGLLLLLWLSTFIFTSEEDAEWQRSDL